MNCLSLERTVENLYCNNCWDCQEYPKPVPYQDGNAWCCGKGENLQVGTSEFGDTPQEAAPKFRAEWKKWNAR